MKGFAAATTATLPLSEAERLWTSIDLGKLRGCLATGAPMPKDMFVHTELADLYRNTFRGRDRNYERSVLHVLVSARTTPDEHDLALSVANCRKGFRCGKQFCFICKQRYWRKRRKLLTPLEDPYPYEALSWATLIIGQSQHGYEPLPAMIETFKRNFTDAAGRRPSTAWLGRLEIDYFDGAIASLQPQKAQTLGDLDWDRACEMPTLIPHAHLVISHPNISRATLTQHLTWTFPGSRRVQLKSLRVTRSRSDSLDAFARYPLKPPIEKPFLARKNSKTHFPRHPAVVCYVLQMHEYFDRHGHRRLLEFDSPRS